MPTKSEKQLSSFSNLAVKDVAKLRNIVNVDDLGRWIQTIANDKISESGALPSSRGGKARAWLSTVGRNWILRQGEIVDFVPSPETLEASPAWVRASMENGRELQELKLLDSEKASLQSIIDWMVSDSGPSMTADWSKVSFAQALEAEKAWIDAMIKEALKRDLEAAEASGTSMFCSAEESLGTGWRWVLVTSKDSLDREGSLMRHCVGSYANDVAEGKKTIYSLRDPNNKPFLTIEAKEHRLEQLRTFANQFCPPSLMPAVREFATEFELHHSGKFVTASDEVKKAGIVPIPRLGLAIRDVQTPEHWRSSLNEMILSGEMDDEKNQSELASALAEARLADLLAIIAPRLSEKSASEAMVAGAASSSLPVLELLSPMISGEPSEALNEACLGGNSGCVEFLLARHAPLSNLSKAIMSAASNGHNKLVERLVSIAGPKTLYLPTLEASAKNGHLDCLMLIIPLVELSDKRWEDLMKFSATAPNTSCLEFILLKINDLKKSSSALLGAVVSNRIDNIKILMPFATDDSQWKIAVDYAITYNKPKCLEELLSISKPSLGDVKWCMDVISNRHKEKEELLTILFDRLEGVLDSVIERKVFHKLMEIAENQKSAEAIEVINKRIEKGQERVVSLSDCFPEKMRSALTSRRLRGAQNGNPETKVARDI